MLYKTWIVLGTLIVSTFASACTPVVIGAGAAVVADEVVERKNGGRGLF